MRALRLVHDDYTSFFEDLLAKDGSVSIHHRNIQNVAIEMFKVKNNLCPEIVQSIFSQTSSRTRSKASFSRPNINTVNYGEQSLRSFGPIMWDTMIPTDIKVISNLQEFKKNIKTWIPHNCPCR